MKNIINVPLFTSRHIFGIYRRLASIFRLAGEKISLKKCLFSKKAKNQEKKGGDMLHFAAFRGNLLERYVLKLHNI